MNKKIVLLIAFTVVSVGLLSGCTDSSGDIQIVDYDVSTSWHTFSGFNKIEHAENGFYHNYPDDVKDDSRNVYYLINGTVKNVGNELVKGITINAICYDENGVELFDTDVPYSSCYDKFGVASLPKGYSDVFQIKIYRNGAGDICDTYFDSVESISLVISISE